MINISSVSKDKIPANFVIMRESQIAEFCTI